VDEPRRPDPPPPAPGDGDGRWGPSIGFLAVALGLIGGTVAAWWTSTSVPGSASGAASAPEQAPARAATPLRVAATASAASGVAPLRMAGGPGGAAAASTPRIPRMRAPGDDQTPDLSDYINEGEQPTMSEVIARLHQAGVHTGLGAFSPPGTRPPLIGLAVPEDFILPPGYVRHYQATDDGQRIEPILMFAPDFQAFDADHHPVAMPPDRVVPPELAPPGLPIRRIVVPAPTASR
jgi:hypothetical protein